MCKLIVNIFLQRVYFWELRGEGFEDLGGNNEKLDKIGQVFSPLFHTFHPKKLFIFSNSANKTLKTIRAKFILKRGAGVEWF